MTLVTPEITPVSNHNVVMALETPQIIVSWDWSFVDLPPNVFPTSWELRRSGDRYPTSASDGDSANSGTWSEGDTSVEVSDTSIDGDVLYMYSIFAKYGALPTMEEKEFIDLRKYVTQFGGIYNSPTTEKFWFCGVALNGRPVVYALEVFESGQHEIVAARYFLDDILIDGEQCIDVTYDGVYLSEPEVVGILTNRRHLIIMPVDEPTEDDIIDEFNLADVLDAGFDVAGGVWEFDYAGTSLLGLLVLDSANKKIYRLDLPGGSINATTDLSNITHTDALYGLTIDRTGVVAPINQPTNVTGVTIEYASIDSPTGTDGELIFTFATSLLTWEAPGEAIVGASIDVSADGVYELTADAGSIIRVKVDASSLPGSDQTDSDIELDDKKVVVFGNHYTLVGIIDDDTVPLDKSVIYHGYIPFTVNSGIGWYLEGSDRTFIVVNEKSFLGGVYILDPTVPAVATANHRLEADEDTISLQHLETTGPLLQAGSGPFESRAGTANNADQQPGIFGYSSLSNSVSGQVNLNYDRLPDLFNTDGKGSIEWWVRFTDSDAQLYDTSVIELLLAQDQTNSKDIRVRLKSLSGIKRLQYYYGTVSDAIIDIVVPDQLLKRPNDWHHFMITWDEAASIQLFVDGKSVGSPTGVMVTIPGPWDVIRIAWREDIYVDEIRISRIVRAFASGVNVYEPFDVGHRGFSRSGRDYTSSYRKPFRDDIFKMLPEHMQISDGLKTTIIQNTQVGEELLFRDGNFTGGEKARLSRFIGLQIDRFQDMIDYLRLQTDVDLCDPDRLSGIARQWGILDYDSVVDPVTMQALSVDSMRLYIKLSQLANARKGTRDALEKLAAFYGYTLGLEVIHPRRTIDTTLITGRDDRPLDSGFDLDSYA